MFAEVVAACLNSSKNNSTARVYCAKGGPRARQQHHRVGYRACAFAHACYPAILINYTLFFCVCVRVLLLRAYVCICPRWCRSSGYSLHIMCGRLHIVSSVCVCANRGKKNAPVLPPSKPPQTADASDWARRNDCCARLAGLLFLLLLCSLPAATHLAGLCVRMFVYDFLCAFAALLQHKRRKDARTHARKRARTLLCETRFISF